jgi:pimeloyl-ACP methyl ester carboxylesterase
VRTWGPAVAAATRPPLLCLHQNPRSSRDFARLAPWLATDRRVYALDTPGCGDSDPPPSPASIAELAQALDEAITAGGAAGRDAALDVFGQHTGATLGLELAASRPGRVRRLALLGIPFVAPPEREAWRLRFAQSRPWVEDPAYLGAQWQRSVEAARGLGLPDEELLARFADALHAAPRAAWAFDAVFRYPFEARLPRVRQPTLVLVVDETIAPNSRAAAALLPAARIVELTELDGRALDAAPGRLATALRAFLDA